uniref:Uncharacterized protein n=1 Tax=Solanum tuberosum TaxID=4113 RepID=M1ACU1_SOLTU
MIWHRGSRRTHHSSLEYPISHCPASLISFHPQVNQMVIIGKKARTRGPKSRRRNKGICGPKTE